MTTQIWITFPSVDMVNPEEDEILERLARALHERGMKAEFIFSGIKVQRTLENRPQTIDALNKTEMTIGYQGNAHSLHPGLMEYVAESEWEDGVAEATHRETEWLYLDGSTNPDRRGGILLLQDTFGERFTGFRGAGGWTPQIMEVLRRNGILVHHTLFDMAEATGQTVASYLGCLQISPGRSKWTGIFPFDSPLTNRLELEQIVRHPADGLPQFINHYQTMLDNYAFRGPRILFVNFHPFFLFTDTIGDILNYSNGRTPEPADNVVRSNLLPQAEMNRRWSVVESIFDWLSGLQDVTFVTSADYVSQAEDLTTTETGAGIEQLAAEVSHLPLMRPPAFVEYNGTAWSLSEAFDLMQRSLAHYDQHGQLPDRLRTRLLLGPRDVPMSESNRIASPTVDQVIQAAAGLTGSTIPSDVVLDDGPVEPYPFLLAMARALLMRDERERTALVRPTEYDFPELAESFNVYLRRGADWDIYRRNLDGARMEKHASLQLWTFKPIA